MRELGMRELGAGDEEQTMAELSIDVIREAAGYLASWLSYRQWLLRIPGVQAAVLFGDQMVLSEAFGQADVENGTPLSITHLFRVASHSKTFTATAVLQLTETGRLRLDDTLGSWLPFLTEPSSPLAALTLRDLLQHSGGVTRDGWDADFWQLHGEFPDAAALRTAALDQAQVLPANDRFKYSNVGYSLLGLVVEAASGRSYADYVTTEIVQRLDLRRTGPELDPARSGEYVVGYSSLDYARDRTPIAPVDTQAMAAATGFYSTAEDLCRYVAAHFTGDTRLLGEPAKRLMQHQWWPVEGQPDGGYGLGMAVQKAGERTLLGHGGGFPGQATRTVFDPADRLAVAVLTNAIDGPPNELALGLVRLLDLAAAQQPDPAGGVERFPVRLANLWGVRDVALLGGRLLLLDPTAVDPTSDGTYGELAVESPTRLRLVSGPGYDAVGEAMDFTFAADGAVESVRAAGGLTWWPLEAYRGWPGGQLSSSVES
jgi:CubicO group peptidase (beta-lactamase class C family)